MPLYPETLTSNENSSTEQKIPEETRNVQLYTTQKFPNLEDGLNFVDEN
jgi:hypothetical protein